MKQFKLECDRLNCGVYVARPDGGLGNMGWYPFPWTAAIANSEKAAKAIFNTQHRDKIAIYNAIGGTIGQFVNQVVDKPLEWQLHGLQQTASGYGSKLTTRYTVNCADGRVRRVYARCYSNTAWFYIIVKGLKVTIPDELMGDQS